MAFNLWTDGVTLVNRFVTLFNKHYIARDPLSGVVDGVNTLFYCNYPPILSSGSVGVYTSGSVPLANSAYSIDYDAGAFTFTAAPAVQPTVTYTNAKYPEHITRSILVAGFDEMEGRWFRGYSLSDVVGVGSIVPITEDSGHAYLVDSSGSDPAIGAGYFSTSHVQQNLYAKCVQLAFYLTLMGEHALTDFIWKEAQGLQIDKSKNVPNLKLAYDALLASLQKALDQAQYEVLGNAAWGGTITPPATREFVAHRWWEKASIDQNWRGTQPYYGQIW